MGRLQEVLADALEHDLAIGVRAALIILVEPPPELSSPPPGEPPTVSPLSVVPVYFMCRAPTRTPM